MIVKELMPMNPSLSFINEYRLDTVEGGTRMTKTIGKPSGPAMGRILIRLLTPIFNRMGNRAMETFANQIETDFQVSSKMPE
jgi:hypothetical protein